MAEDNMGSTMAGGMTVMIMLALMVGIMGMYQPAAPTVYTCHLCGATFSSLADLQTHFDQEHPGEPINIEWGD